MLNEQLRNIIRYRAPMARIEILLEGESIPRRIQRVEVHYDNRGNDSAIRFIPESRATARMGKSQRPPHPPINLSTSSLRRQ